MKKIFVLLFLLTQFIFAQQNVDKLMYLSSNKVSVTAQYQSIKIGDEKLSQIAFPVNISVPFSNRVTMSIYNGSALSKYEGTDLNGLGETRVGLRYIFPGEGLMIRGLFGLPSGKTKLSADQFYLSQLLSLNPLDYMVSYYGQGFNSNISVAYAFPISRKVVIGAGAAYNYRGAFIPREVETGGEFDPGDDISADLGIDFKLADNFKVNIDVLYTLFSRDKLDDVEIFELGDRISIYTGFNFRAFGMNHNLFAISRIKSDNKSFSEESQDDLKTGTQLDINYFGSIPLSYLYSLFIKADGKIYKDSEQMVAGELLKTGEANIFSLGGGVRLNLSDYTSIEANAEYKTGNITLPLSLEKDDISGFSAGLCAIFKF